MADASCGKVTPAQLLLDVGNGPFSTPDGTAPGFHVARGGPLPPTPAGSANSSTISCGAGAPLPGQPLPQLNNTSQFVSLRSPSNSSKFPSGPAAAVKLRPRVISCADSVVLSSPADTSERPSIAHVGTQVTGSATGGAARSAPPRPT